MSVPRGKPPSTAKPLCLPAPSSLPSCPLPRQLVQSCCEAQGLQLHVLSRSRPWCVSGVPWKGRRRRWAACPQCPCPNGHVHLENKDPICPLLLSHFSALSLEPAPAWWPRDSLLLLAAGITAAERLLHYAPSGLPPRLGLLILSVPPSRLLESMGRNYSLSFTEAEWGWPLLGKK